MSTLLESNKVEQAPLTLDDIQDDIFETKKEILRLQFEREELFRKRKLWYFVPTPKQYPFFENADKKRRAGFTGNRFGKSTLGVVEDCCWLIGYRPFFPEGHPLRTLGIPKHGVKGLLIAEDWDKVKEIFTNEDSSDRLGKFIEYLPEDFIKKVHRNAKGIIEHIVIVSEIDGHKRESSLFFDTVHSYKNSPRSFESSDWDFIHLDEPVMKALWIAISRGLIDRGGYAWWLCTPITELWMYSETIQNTKDYPHLFWWFEASMDDNPLLSEEDKQLYLDQLPPDERAARKAGTPLAYGRLVFGWYSEDYHVVESVPAWPNPNKPPPQNMVVYAIDTHPQTPHAILFISISPADEIDIYDEVYEKGTIREMARLVKARIDGVRVHYGLCEPAAWNEDQGSGQSYADMFYEEGLDLIPGSKRKEDAILKVQALFKQKLRTIRIHKRCKRLRWELMNHYFDKDNRPEDKEDHIIECFRRLVIHDNLTYYPPYFVDKPQQFTNEPLLRVSQTHLDLSFVSVPSLTNI